MIAKVVLSSSDVYYGQYEEPKLGHFYIHTEEPAVLADLSINITRPHIYLQQYEKIEKFHE